MNVGRSVGRAVKPSGRMYVLLDGWNFILPEFATQPGGSEARGILIGNF